MEPPKTQVSIGQFPIIEVKLNAIRISLGQGVNCWIHTNFEHGARVDDIVNLIAEIPYANPRSTPVQ